jgi:hypothetical protein
MPVPPPTLWDGTYVADSTWTCNALTDAGVTLFSNGFTVDDNVIQNPANGNISIGRDGSAHVRYTSLGDLADGEFDVNVQFFRKSDGSLAATLTYNVTITAIMGVPYRGSCSGSITATNTSSSNTVTTHVGDASLYVVTGAGTNLSAPGNFPEEIRISNHDWIYDLAWTTTDDTASTKAKFEFLDCTPFCFNGTWHTYKASITASDAKSCTFVLTGVDGQEQSTTAYVFTRVRVQIDGPVTNLDNPFSLLAPDELTCR